MPNVPAGGQRNSAAPVAGGDRYQKFRQTTGSIEPLAGTTPERRYAMLLGLRTGDAGTDALIDKVSKRMLREIWNERRALTQSVNEIFGRQDLVQ